MNSEDTSSELIANDLDDIIHDRMDREVFEDTLKPIDFWTATSLLLTIASAVGSRLDPKYKDINNVKTLLRANPTIIDKLKAAWTAGSFKGIRNLGASPAIFSSSYKLFTQHNFGLLLHPRLRVILLKLMMSKWRVRPLFQLYLCSI
jgi:hypothetical protein